jgi:hypothetical protein
MANMVPAVPTAEASIPSLQVSVEALKQNVEVLTGIHRSVHLPTAPKTSASIAVDAAIAAVKRLNP